MPERLTFGSSVRPARSATRAEWIRTACFGEPGTVASLVPQEKFPRIVRVGAPGPAPGDWWTDYRRLFSLIASVGEGYTGTPNLAWFAIWEGHGFDEAASAEIDLIPRFQLPDRTYLLLEGTVAAVDTLRYPGFDGWRNPDLFWPDDRQWFVATDVDFWSLYVAGDDDFITALQTHTWTAVEEAGPARELDLED